MSILAAWAVFGSVFNQNNRAAAFSAHLIIAHGHIKGLIAMVRGCVAM